MHMFLTVLPALVILILFLIVKYVKYVNRKELREQLYDLHDCPFTFTLDDNEYRTCVIFDLGEATLWCEYKFGVKSDGIYGVKELSLTGINAHNQREITLKTGQSIFPVILKVEEFENWTKTKAFKVSWDTDFSRCWEATIKGLDNLKYLESKSKEKDNE